MGYSTGFLRSFLALLTLVALVLLSVAGLNELLGLGLWPDGYPALGSTSGLAFDQFALRLGAFIAFSVALSLLLGGRSR